MKCKATLGGKLMFPGKYLAFEDLNGKDYTLTIARVEFLSLHMNGSDNETKAVITFREATKKLVLNKTNTVTIEGLHGSNGDLWAGKRITLFPTRDKQWDCIRIRPTVPAGAGNESLTNAEMDAVRESETVEAGGEQGELLASGGRTGHAK